MIFLYEYTGFWLHLSLTDEPAKLDSGCQIFRDPNDEKESDLVGYDWDSIGSFEDLDKIFR